MRRHLHTMLSLGLHIGLIAGLATGCSKNMDEEEDGGAGEDMALASQGDGRMGGGDMSVPLDFRGEAIAVIGLPQGCPTGVTAEKVYEEVVATQCATAAKCHSLENPTLFGIGNVMDMKRRWVNNTSVQASPMPRVKPGNVDQSYVLYKVMEQHQKAGGIGKRMPPGRQMLTSDEICKLVSWIKEGAN